ncbi:MAG: hypothetical protein LBJ31_05355 [Treponema sp.]|jgi:hypothetical protein|nr:hypothetical protein [Treponema sp.]
METLLALIPHRDLFPVFFKWKEALFNSGVDGAWSLPVFCPLARLERALDREELRCEAIRLRSLLGGGKFSLGEPACVPLARGEGSRIYGPLLCIETDAGAKTFPPAAVPGAVIPPLLAAAVLYGDEEAPAVPPPRFCFRAAALANLSLDPPRHSEPGDSPEALYSFTWKFGAPRWLPKKA